MDDHGIVWFRRDLRLDDNPAWAVATKRHDPVTAVLVLVIETGGRFRVEHGDPAVLIP